MQIDSPRQQENVQTNPLPQHSPQHTPTEREIPTPTFINPAENSAVTVLNYNTQLEDLGKNLDLDTHSFLPNSNFGPHITVVNLEQISQWTDEEWSSFIEQKKENRQG